MLKVLINKILLLLFNILNNTLFTDQFIFMGKLLFYLRVVKQQINKSSVPITFL